MARAFFSRATVASILLASLIFSSVSSQSLLLFVTALRSWERTLLAWVCVVFGGSDDAPLVALFVDLPSLVIWITRLGPPF